jgi:hypothetical protein
MPVRRTPQRRGQEKDRAFAEQHGLEVMSNSGATPRAKLDAGDFDMIWEIKYTSHASYRLTAEDVLKAERGARGPEGRDVVWAFAIEMDGAGGDVSVLRTEDLLRIARGEVKLELRASKRAALLAGAEPNRYDDPD